ncbi:MAG: DUF4011 domain-containing protein, partial [Chloroflexota bacterium]
MDHIKDQLEAARRGLLDLSLRNPLLNYKLKKARGVNIIDERSEQLYQRLVEKGRSMTFLPAPDSYSEFDSGEFPIPDLVETNGKGAKRHTDSKLQTTHGPPDLQKRLLYTDHLARTYIEEQGVNILFLVLGMLEWHEDGEPDPLRRAPLLLIPVDLDRKSVAAAFSLSYTEGDVGGNLSLKEKLKQQWIDLPLPALDSETDEPFLPSAYCQQVAEAVAHKQTWRVLPDEIALGFFSFGTFLMYNDLDLAVWGDQIPGLSHVSSLLERGFSHQQTPFDDDIFLDDYVTPQNSYHVVDADSSQTLALLDVAVGRNLVIQGPPGTGKSQTITNIIAEAIGRDETVLFVSEKMAALEVVKRRLDSIGVGDACLELHSHKSNKKHFLAELERTINLGNPESRGDVEHENQLGEKIDRLNLYRQAVNEPIGQSGVTPYDAYGHLLDLYAAYEIRQPNIGFADVNLISGKAFRTIREATLELQVKLKSIGSPSVHPFWGSTLKSSSPQAKRKIKALCDEVLELFNKLMELATELGGWINVKPTTQTDLKRIEALCRRVQKFPPLLGIDIHSPAWQDPSFQKKVADVARFVRLHQQYDASVTPDAWQADLLDTRKVLSSLGNKWWRFTSPQYRSAQNTLASYINGDLPAELEDQLSLIDAILAVQRSQPLYNEGAPFLEAHAGDYYQRGDTNWAELTAIVTSIQTLYQEIDEGGLPAQITDLIKYNDLFSNAFDRSYRQFSQYFALYSVKIESLLSNLAIPDKFRFGPETTFAILSLMEQKAVVATWASEVNRLDEIASLNLMYEALRERHMEKLVRLSHTWPEANELLVPLLDRSWYEALLEFAKDERPALNQFDGAIHSQQISDFKQLDVDQFRNNQIQVAWRHWRNLPKQQQGTGQMGTLLREFKKKRRHKPIRRVIREAGQAIQAIKPVFMMSPLSIAMYLEPHGVQFDLVIFDEASQVRPEDALGALLRGRRVVVVGDSQQLPPTSFFRNDADDGLADDFSVADTQSILDLFVARGAPQRTLRWHYRSQHHSLIAVSNQAFYSRRLVIFPSPDESSQHVGLRFHHLPETVYDRGGSRSNLGEADIVAAAVMDHAAHYPNLSLGVVAFSKAQENSIRDAVERNRRENQANEAFFLESHPHEPFFIKNLENVQGDERDVIFISIGYGRTASGKLYQNFGPLNKDGGEKRLNVLISRAKKRCEVFSNIVGADIEATASKGVEALQTFLTYAETGSLPGESGTAANHNRGSTNSQLPVFDQIVADALRAKGYEVVPRFGVGQFQIDLAVVDPDWPDRFVVAVECDGPSYFRSRSARDRDRLRQQVLERMDWTYCRVWSSDWFKNQTREIEKLVDLIET